MPGFQPSIPRPGVLPAQEHTHQTSSHLNERMSTHRRGTSTTLQTMATERKALRFINQDGTIAKDFLTKARYRYANGQMAYQTPQDVWDAQILNIKELLAKGFTFQGVIDK